jgi:general secretion pathway protein F
MALFSYLAVCPKGSSVRGTWVGQSASDLYIHLKSQNLTLVRHKKRSKMWTWSVDFIRHKRNFMPFFSTQMHELLAAKIYFMDALSIVMKSQETQSIQVALLETMQRVEKGESLSTAFQTHPIFDVFFTSSLHMAEKTGDLAQAFKNLAIFYTQKNERHGALKKALAYPSLLFFVISLIFYGLGTLILPNMEQLFHTLNVENQSLAFHSLQAFVAFFKTYGSFLAILIFVAFLTGISLVFLKKTKHAKMLIPIVGHIQRGFALADFLNYLCLLLNQKEDLVSALNAATQSIQCKGMRGVLEKIALNIQQGKNLKSACEETQTFPPAVLKLIDIGERTGQLPTMLALASENLSRQTLAKVDTLIGWCGPVLISVMGGVILWIVFATVVPVYDILAVLHF